MRKEGIPHDSILNVSPVQRGDRVVFEVSNQRFRLPELKPDVLKRDVERLSRKFELSIVIGVPMVTGALGLWVGQQFNLGLGLTGYLSVGGLFLGVVGFDIPFLMRRWQNNFRFDQ